MRSIADWAKRRVFEVVDCQIGDVEAMFIHRLEVRIV